MTSPPKRVLIIGAGLGGTAFSIALSNRSISSVICELRDTPGTIGGAVALSPNALRVLDRLGVYDTIRTQGFNFDNMRFVNESGAIIGDFAVGGGKLGHSTIRIARSLLLKALHEEAARRGVPIKFSKKAVRVEEDEESATVFFEDGTSETADLVVGYDGIHSNVRRFVLGEHAVPEYSGFTGIGSIVPKSKIIFPTENYKMPAAITGQKGAFVMMPSDYAGEQINCFTTAEFPSDRSREEWADFARDEALPYIRDKLKTWPEPVKSMMTALEADSVHIWPQYRLPDLPLWHTKRVIIAGDAVHAIPPHAGQGAAMAFEDGALLSRALSMLSSSYPLTVALEQWEHARRERLKFAIAFTQRSSETRREVSWIQEIVKEWGMWVFMKLRSETAGAGLYAYDTEDVKLGA